jgi:hypothetical protein
VLEPVTSGSIGIDHETLARHGYDHDDQLPSVRLRAQEERKTAD